ncbi:REP element-mobilizing transposase RayT [Pseudomonas sp. NFACC02]|uniref:REP-associated tyrosine transposase n=1 Tax=Pseudomonas sp. NFACC02 TaxID=1566250 RepID=UPI0008CB986C|nr:transposase [Pseudomonas sp. NFACC02]SER75633.1 REP element-mobilizing transposase RayT [Pseudomonas sp. NFACC02]
MSEISPGGNRLRFGRYSESGGIYLLTSVTLNRSPFFGDWQMGRLLVNAFRRAEEEGAVRSLAWVVMPDHFHWLVELQNVHLPVLMCKTKSRTVRTFNDATGNCHRLWQRGYHDRAVRREEDLQAIARYIVMNPVRAGLVRRVHDYPLWDAIWL